MDGDASFLPTLATNAGLLAERRGRRRRQLVAARLIFVTIGALFGALTITGSLGGQRLDYAGVAALVAFLVVLGIRLTMLGDRDLETSESRLSAVAELVTSHAWRYAMGARPYARAADEDGGGARELLLTNLGKYHGAVRHLLQPGVARQVTPSMEKLRAAPLPERMENYLAGRVSPLDTASGRLSGRLGVKATALGVLVLCVELIGIPAGAVKAFGVSTFDLLGVTAAAAASLGLWIETTNYRERARAARDTTNKLALSHDYLTDRSHTEHEWAAAVARIENLLTFEAEALLSADPDTPSLDAASERIMSPDGYFDAATELKRQIWEHNDRLPKLEPDVIVAVNPGGAILGGILYFKTRASAFLPLSLRGGVEADAIRSYLRAASWPNRKQGLLSVLVVDASMKSGGSLARAIELIREAIESKGWRRNAHDAPSDETMKGIYVIRTAVIVKKPIATPETDERVDIDYYVDEITEQFPYGHI